MVHKSYRTRLYVLLLFIILSGCVPAPQLTQALPTATLLLPTPSPLPTSIPATPVPQVWQLLLLGDSSLGYLDEVYPPLVERDLGVKIEVLNYSLSGLSMDEVLQFLKNGKLLRRDLLGLPEAINQSELVIIFIGNPDGSLIPSNQFDMFGCIDGNFRPANCDPASLEQYTADLAWIYGEILRLRGGEATIIKTMDLYTPKITQYIKNNILADCTLCFENYSNAIRLAAEPYNIPVIHRYDIFNGVNHDEDPIAKGYIWEDGEHPSLIGAQLVAEAFAESGYEPAVAP